MLLWGILSQTVIVNRTIETLRTVHYLGTYRTRWENRSTCAPSGPHEQQDPAFGGPWHGTNCTVWGTNPQPQRGSSGTQCRGHEKYNRVSIRVRAIRRFSEGLGQGLLSVERGVVEFIIVVLPLLSNN